MYRTFSWGQDDGRFKVIVFLGTVRENRIGIRVAKFVVNQLKSSKHKVELFDPQEISFPLVRCPIHYYKDPSKVPLWLTFLESKIRQADAFVIVSGEYNETIPPALTNMMDHFPPRAYAWKPCAVVTYSANEFGGRRVSTHMKNFICHLHMCSIPCEMNIGTVTQALDEQGQPQNAGLLPQIEQLLSQLDWYTEALKKQRDEKGIPA